MAPKAKILINFGRLKDDELQVFVKTVINAMTGNLHFPSPSPSLADIQMLLDDFSDKLSVARKRGSPEDTALKNESRDPLIQDIQKLSYYVNAIAQGKLSTLLSSGFRTKTPSTAGLIPLRPENILLRDGRQSGQVRLDFAQQKGIRIYEYAHRVVSPNEQWSDRLTTTSSRANIIAPLIVGLEYEIRVRAVNTQGISDWSNLSRILVR